MDNTVSEHGEDSPSPLCAELDLARSAESFRNARIMVVDDEMANVDLLIRVLRMAGATDLHGVTHPRDAVAACLEVHPDLLLLDLHMGDVDGLEVLEGLRVLIDDHLAVLVLSGDSSGDARRQVLAAGAREFITKPFDLVELVRRIRTELETRRRVAST